jgi:D-sedoheptulose 7-phosphate isomerase
MIGAFRQGRKLLAFGNGGSASDAQHFCGELVVRFERERRALPAVARCCDAAVVSACGNDYCYEEIFARQVHALGQPGDVAVAISTSGKSQNIVRALKAAREKQLLTVLFTGPRISPACEFADLVIAAPAETTAGIQELHLASYHAICEIIDAAFVGNAG